MNSYCVLCSAFSLASGSSQRRILYGVYTNMSNVPSQSMTSEHLRALWGTYWDARTAKPRALTAWEALGAWFRSRPTDASKPLDILPENAESLAIKARIEGITRAITARDTEHVSELRAADVGIERLKKALNQERKYKIRWKKWSKMAWKKKCFTTFP